MVRKTRAGSDAGKREQGKAASGAASRAASEAASGVTIEVRERMRRGFNNFLTYWTVCPNPRCKRARACAGEVTSCHELCWPHVPEDIKLWLQNVSQQLAAGVPPIEAARAAERHVAACKEAQARFEKREAEAKADALARVADARAKSSGAQPRVRMV